MRERRLLPARVGEEHCPAPEKQEDIEEHAMPFSEFGMRGAEVG
jgi:hypothetical protein